MRQISKISSLLVLITVVFLSGCKPELDDLPVAKYTVTFDSDGGTEVEEQIVESEMTVEKPSDPTKNGFSFCGWYKDDEVFDFEKPVTKDITLKAKWLLITYTVTFDTDGGVPAPEKQIVAINQSITQPLTPSKEGYLFDAWYNGEIIFDFTTKITEDINLKAKWIQVCTVTFNTNDGSIISPQRIECGMKVTKPSDPTKTSDEAGNYVFEAWFSDSALTKEFDFNTAIIGNITLYAKWKKVIDNSENSNANENQVSKETQSKSNPTFMVIMSKPLTKDVNGIYSFTDNVISCGGQAIIDVSPGLDGFLLDEASLKIYAQKYESGYYVGEKLYPQVVKQEHGTSYKFIAVINRSDGFEIGKTYIWGVEGNDQSEAKNTIKPAIDAYGFKLIASGNNPRITITSPVDTYTYINGNTMLFEGIVSAELYLPEINIYLNDNQTPIYTIKATDLIPIPSTSEEDEYSFSWTYTGRGDKISFVATLNSQKIQTIERIVTYDGELPKIYIDTIYPIVERNSKNNNINGIFNLCGKISDNIHVNEASLEVWQNDTKVSSVNFNKAIFLSGGKFEETIDTTLLEDKKEIRLVITAHDMAGNAAVREETYFVDQSTDKPEIYSNSNNLVLTDSESVFNDDNNFLIAGSNLDLKISEDDSIKYADIKLEEKKSDGSYILTDISNSNISISYSRISCRLPEKKGIYRVTVTVYDNNYISESATPNNFTKTVFYIKTTGCGPIVTITPEKEYISTLNAAAKYMLTFTVDGTKTDEKFKLYRDGILVNGEEGQSSPIIYETEEFAVGTTNVPKMRFKVVTSDLGKTETVFMPRIDNEPPVINILSPKSNNSEILCLNEQRGFYGNVKDSISGIANVFYKFVKFDESKTLDELQETDEYISLGQNVSGSFVIDIDFIKGSTHQNGKLEEGDWYLFVKAQDNAGNFSNYDYLQFSINLQ